MNRNPNLKSFLHNATGINSKSHMIKKKGKGCEKKIILFDHSTLLTRKWNNWESRVTGQTNKITIVMMNSVSKMADKKSH